MRRRVLPSLLLPCLLVAPAGLVPPPAAEARSGRRELHALLAEHWEWTLQDDPERASTLGDHRFDRSWPDLTLGAQAARARHLADVLERVEAIPAERLAPADRMDRELFRRQVADRLEEHGFETWLMPLNQRGGIQSQHALVDRLALDTPQRWDDWLTRMRALGDQVDATIALMREGVRRGMVHPRVIMERVPAQIAHQVVEDPTDSPFYTAFESLPESFPERDRLRAEARDAIASVLVPAYRRFARFFEQEYLPACRVTVGASSLPRGRELYAFRVRRYTTTSMTPEQVHDLGLREVARIRALMDRVIERIGFEGTFDEFLEHLRTDPRYHVSDPDELLRRYRATAKRIDPEVVRLFGRIPRAPYGVRPIPAEIAPDTTTAYYTQPAADGSVAGTYWVNLHAPETRYLWEMPALTLHEAVPGHHFQIALAQELGELPAFRRHGGYTAFVEGWGLYAESLGEEMGVYRTPYERFGRLTYEMWRAVRLVVDTGLHAFGWERQRTIDYFAANAPRSLGDIVNEIDRYIAWPGQALAYKVGELEIRRLRALAEDQLGERFDVRAFHDVVLGSGAVPLDVLALQVQDWIDRVREDARPRIGRRNRLGR